MLVFLSVEIVGVYVAFSLCFASCVVDTAGFGKIGENAGCWEVSTCKMRVHVHTLQRGLSGHDYTIGTLDVLQACDACADMGMTYSDIVQCTDCVVFRPVIVR